MPDASSPAVSQMTGPVAHKRRSMGVWGGGDSWLMEEQSIINGEHLGVVNAQCQTFQLVLSPLGKQR